MPRQIAALGERRSRPTAHTRTSQVAQIGPLGKPVGAVVGAANVLRVLHASNRPLNASETTCGGSASRNRVQHFTDPAGRRFCRL